jgi:hypothetical protein
MIGMIITLISIILIAVINEISEIMDEAFRDGWLSFDEPSDDSPDLDNSEYDWGHNIKGYHYEDEEL